MCLRKEDINSSILSYKWEHVIYVMLYFLQYKRKEGAWEKERERHYICSRFKRLKSRTTKWNNVWSLTPGVKKLAIKVILEYVNIFKCKININ